MKGTIRLLLVIIVLSITSSLAFATSTATSSGTLSVNWNQDSGAFIWDSTSEVPSPIYGMNGADAIWGTENFSFDGNNNRIYDQHVSDYSSPLWVSNLAGVIDSSSAGYGTAILGEASTTTNSVSSIADVTNDGEGLTLNASGTSHLVRNFTLSTTGDFSFDADYAFLDSVILDDPLTESADCYHHANLTLGYQTDSTLILLSEEVQAYELSNFDTATGTLSVIDPNGWIVGRQYSIELHTYNSASAYSPLNETAPVPEPATFILLGGGLAGLAFYRRNKK